MKKVVTTGNRAGVFKLLEMLVQRPDLSFVHLSSFARCLEQVEAAPPALLLIDCETDTLKDCAWLLEELRTRDSARKIRTLLIAAPDVDAEDLAALKKGADGCLKEPFNPLEIGQIAQKYL